MDHHKNHKSGFSLIELMVAIGIIALLAAIATPVYTQYSIKSNVASALPILEGLKAQASEYYTTIGNFPANLAAINAVSYSDAIIQSSTVSTASCPNIAGKIGCVQVTFLNTARAGYPLNNQILSLVAIDSSTVIQWVCKSGNNTGGTTIINNDYLPKACQ